ncbi:protein POLR1D [Mauremys mutica]|nr:protein POLR1D [Mauremys mutica]XP_044872956.1 protein POLR1D [Mauremys mutica]
MEGEATVAATSGDEAPARPALHGVLAPAAPLRPFAPPCPQPRAVDGPGLRLYLSRRCGVSGLAGPRRICLRPAAMEEDMELERKAVEELLKEAKRGKTRAETMGAMGWMKCPLAGTNKRFLINTIKNTLPSQKEQDQEHEQEEDSKPPEPSESRKEEKPKKHRTYPYTPSFQARRRVSYSPPRYRNRSRHTKDKYEK